MGNPATRGQLSEYYGVSATTTIGSTSIAGDSQFALTNTGCAGAKSCVETVTFNAGVGGDYAATLGVTSTSAVRTYANSTKLVIQAHVVGANYTLVPVAPTLNITAPNTVGTMAFTVTPTGEMPLQITGMTTGDILAANGTKNDSGRASIVGSTCSDILAAGSTCTITVQYDAGTIESDIGYYSTPLLLSVTGNTRQQAPAKASVYVTL